MCVRECTRVYVWARMCVCVSLCDVSVYVCVCVNTLNNPVFLTFHPKDFKAKSVNAALITTMCSISLNWSSVNLIKVINNNSAHSSIPQPISRHEYLSGVVRLKCCLSSG